MLQKAHFPLVLAQGVDTKTDPKVVPAGKLLVLENGRLTTTGRISKSKGYTCFSKNIVGSSEMISNGRTVTNFKDELLLFSQKNLYSYVSASDAWLDRGIVGVARVESDSVIRNSGNQSVQSVAYSRGVFVYAWEDSTGGVRASVVDAESGLPVQQNVLISATGTRPRVTATPTSLYVHWMDSSNLFQGKKLNPLEPQTFGSTVTVANDANATNPNFDIKTHGNNMVFCYATQANTVKLGYLKSNGGAGTPVDGFPAVVTWSENGASSVAITSSANGNANDFIYVFAANTTDGLQCAIYPLDLSAPIESVIDPTTTQINQITALHSTETKVRIWYELEAASSTNLFIKSDTINSNGNLDSTGTDPGTGAVWQRGLGLASKAFAPGDGNIYLVGVYDSALQPTYFTMLDVSSTRGVVVNNMAQGQAGGKLAKRSALTSVPTPGNMVRVFPALIKSRLSSDGGNVFTLTGIQSGKIRFNQSEAIDTKELGGNLIIAGGLVQEYDGVSAFESGFHYFPETPSNVIATTSGDIESGTRQYVVVYEWTDNQGQIHRSAPSVPLSVTNAADDENTLTIPTIRLTEKKAASGRASVVISVFRTTDGGTLFYKVSSTASPLLNDTSVDTVAFVDDLSDGDITTSELLYTTGGVLENIAPPSASVVADYRERIILAGGEDKNKVGFSRQVLAGEPVNFSDALSFRCDQGGDKVTALVALDEKLIIFKNSTAHVQVGEGPLDTGAQNDFQVPQIISGDVGCPYPQSIVAMPQGLVFKSLKGFYLLTRSLEFVEIGNEVQAYNNLNTTAGTLFSTENEIRWVHSDGLQLVYDYEHRQWLTDTGILSVSATVWRGDYVFLKANGEVCRESQTTFLNNGATVATRIRTGWLNMEKLQHALRIYRFLAILENRSRHILRIRLFYDYDYSVRETFLFNTENILGNNYFGQDIYYGASQFYGGQDGQYQIEVCPKIQKCQAIMIEVDDLNPDGVDGAGPALTGFYFEVGIKKGVHRMPVTKRPVGASNAG